MRPAARQGMSPRPAMPLRTALVYLLCAFLWGSTWMAIRVGLDDLPPLLFAGTRMVLAAALLTPLALRRGLGKAAAYPWGRIAFTGQLQIGLPYALLFTAQQWVPSGLAAVLFATFPVWLVLFARVLLPDEPLTARKLAAAALGVVGILVLQSEELGRVGLSGRLALGGLLVTAGAASIAVANLLVKRGLGHVPPPSLVWGQTASGGLLLLVLAALLEPGQVGRWTPRALGALVYLALLGTAVTYVALFWLLPRISVVALGALPLLDTLVAVTLGVVVLGERLGARQWLGGALILSAAALANLVRPAPPRPAVPPAAG